MCLKTKLTDPQKEQLKSCSQIKEIGILINEKFTRSLCVLGLCSGMCLELDWIGLDWIGLDWIGLDWIGLDWIGLDWIGLDWIGFI